MARVAVLLSLTYALWQTLRPNAKSGPVIATTVSGLSRNVKALIASETGTRISLDVDRTPAAADRALLRALVAAGHPVQWRGDIPALALDASRDREPIASVRVSVINAAKGQVVITDSAGVLDSIVALDGASLALGTVVGSVRANAGKFAASAPVPVPAPSRAVLVLGKAGWESKFVADALTEAGWIVRSTSPIAPGIDVRDDALLPLDTSRYDAVIALDSTASSFAQNITQFVASGGGLIAAGTALDLPRLRDILPASAGELRPAKSMLTEDTITAHDLPMRHLANVRNQAVVLGREAGSAITAAARSGLGRVMAVGYDETWRLRMLGGESGLPAHREWWSRAVGAVAPDRTLFTQDQSDAAPRAAMLAEFGEPAKSALTSSTNGAYTLPLFLLLLIVVALVGEVASRRLRGAP